MNISAPPPPCEVTTFSAGWAMGACGSCYYCPSEKKRRRDTLARRLASTRIDTAREIAAERDVAQAEADARPAATTKCESSPPAWALPPMLPVEPDDSQNLAPGLPPTLPKSVSDLFEGTSGNELDSAPQLSPAAAESERSFYCQPPVNRAVSLIHRYVLREEAALLLQTTWRLVLLTRAAQRLRMISVDVEREAVHLAEAVATASMRESSRESYRDDAEAPLARGSEVAGATRSYDPSHVPASQPKGTPAPPDAPSVVAGAPVPAPALLPPGASTAALAPEAAPISSVFASLGHLLVPPADPAPSATPPIGVDEVVAEIGAPLALPAPAAKTVSSCEREDGVNATTVSSCKRDDSVNARAASSAVVSLDGSTSAQPPFPASAPPPAPPAPAPALPPAPPPAPPPTAAAPGRERAVTGAAGIDVADYTLQELEERAEEKRRAAQQAAKAADDARLAAAEARQKAEARLAAARRRREPRASRR